MEVIYSCTMQTDVPVHQGEDLGRGLMSKILNDAEVSRKALQAWLQKKKG